MNKKYLRLVFLLLLALQTLVFAHECEKCNIEPLKTVATSDSLTLEQVMSFICTLDSSCSTDVEFSQWSNKLIFELIEKDINLLNKACHRLGYNYAVLVAGEIESPVEEIDPIRIYEIIGTGIAPKDMVLIQKRAIIKAAEKQGIIIDEK